MTDPESPETPDQELPPGVPEPPDMEKVRDLRQRMTKNRSGHRRKPLSQDHGKQARDIGTYTIIPMMMVAGPLVGYLMGKGLENLFGGTAVAERGGHAVRTGGGLRQIFLLLARKGKKEED